MNSETIAKPASSLNSFSDDTRQRFARLSDGDQLLYLTLFAWGYRRTIIREEKEYTEVLFRIPARRKFRQTSIFGSMFDQEKPSWIGAFEKSFYQTEYSKKKAYRYLDLGLKAIYVEAIKNFYSEGASARDQKHIERAMRQFNALGDSTRSPAVAVTLALRYRYLYELIKRMRTNRGSFDSEIDRIVPAKKGKAFLRMLGQDQDLDNVHENFYGRKMTPRDLTMKIVSWELRRCGFKFKKKRIEEYIAFGGKILGRWRKITLTAFENMGKSRLSIPRSVPRRLEPQKKKNNVQR